MKGRDLSGSFPLWRLAFGDNFRVFCISAERHRGLYRGQPGVTWAPNWPCFSLPHHTLLPLLYLHFPLLGRFSSFTVWVNFVKLYIIKGQKLFIEYSLFIFIQGTCPQGAGLIFSPVVCKQPVTEVTVLLISGDSPAYEEWCLPWIQMEKLINF